jgi:hypothetical protein
LTRITVGCGVGSKCQDSDNGRFKKLHDRTTSSMGSRAMSRPKPEISLGFIPRPHVLLLP